jgi:hypothetical protein
MTESQKPIATGILIVSGIFALMEIAVSILLCIAPESVLDAADLTASGVRYLFYMWAARQFALGFIFAFATFKRSAPMLTITYIFFLVMFVGDFFVGISQHESGVMVSAVVMCAISSVMIFAINRRN